MRSVFGRSPEPSSGPNRYFPYCGCDQDGRSVVIPCHVPRRGSLVRCHTPPNEPYDLVDEGLIEKYDIIEDGAFKTIRIALKYGADKNEKVITGLKRISKPGLRVYANTEDIPRVLGGLGTAIISTNKGVVTDKEARKLGVGGEVLCFVW